jgi:hypothetical protein
MEQKKVGGFFFGFFSLFKLITKKGYKKLIFSILKTNYKKRDKKSINKHKQKQKKNKQKPHIVLNQ